MTSIQTSFSELIAAIHREQYFVPLFEATMAGHGMDVDSADAGLFDDGAIIDMVNDFWFELPDSPTIRRIPFGLVCDIAQNAGEEPEGFGTNGFND